MAEVVQAKIIFADNMKNIIGRHSLKELVREANAAGIAMNYPYVNTVRKGEVNVSTDKCDAIVSMLKLLPGFDSIELWMMFSPGYFKANTHAKFTAPNHVDGLNSFISELMATANTLKLVSVTDEQIQQLIVLSKYVYGK